ncbi:MAG: T9SS type A sorting domain-containing protein [Bacteroidetes bacterium]|nr:T9SS type A sorting domain-containing protein [Bacteroidota bacterium]
MKRFASVLIILGFMVPGFASAMPPPLPVVLVTFTASPNVDKTIDIQWSTQQEINSNNFTIERSSDGSNWTDIGSVKAKGFSSQVSNYSFTDLYPLNGITYYRLRIMNLDGDIGFTETRVVRLSIEKTFIVYPNPAKDNLNICLREASAVQLTLRLINVNGQILLERKIESGKGTTVSLSLKKYTPGTYLLQVAGSDGIKQTSTVFIAR